LTGKEFEKGEKNLYNQVSEYFDSIGNSVYNKELGDIGLTRHGVRDDIAHGMGGLKAATFKAVPDVLENGEIISYTESHKGRGYDTAIIAAPVNIGGDRHYVVAVVRRDKKQARRSITQRFSLHEVYTDKKTSGLFETVRHLLQDGKHRNPDVEIGGWQEPGAHLPRAHVRNELAHSTDNKISDFYSDVNSKDKKFSAAPGKAIINYDKGAAPDVSAYGTPERLTA
jgi:hypothetical protein